MSERAPREKALRDIKVGDIFHAEGSHGGPLICLATSITETTINARTVTQGYEFKFDRRTGIGGGPDHSAKGFIDSVAPLPPDIYEALLSLDLKRKNWDGPLTEDQKRALIFTSRYYAANPL